ncbi:hypothetical protein MLD38_019997 [Melastoma candidum]|uniref:Uncharacterized protein n=1 Tax=Melastoma candidum TaxID=119954 RepID=A0ACB9QFA7_9MYRT|nr:hypothetical protein MLD38_019997 [Melastoma candidum]
MIVERMTTCHVREMMASSATTDANNFLCAEEKPGSDAPHQSDCSQSGCLDCNICLDSAQDPVVTLCGHLYCWPCIYKWLRVQDASSEDPEQRHQCPVCKSEVSDSTLVPLYYRGQTTKPPMNSNQDLGIVIPRRPLGPAHVPIAPRSTTDSTVSRPTEQIYGLYHPQHPLQFSQTSYHHPGSTMLSLSGTTLSIIYPIVGTFSEIVFGRHSGNSLTNIYTYPNSYSIVWDSNSRMRRQAKEANKSLSRVCLFLLCCLLLCLLLF